MRPLDHSDNPICTVRERTLCWSSSSLSSRWPWLVVVPSRWPGLVAPESRPVTWLLACVARVGRVVLIWSAAHRLFFLLPVACMPVLCSFRALACGYGALVIVMTTTSTMTMAMAVLVAPALSRPCGSRGSWLTVEICVLVSRLLALLMGRVRLTRGMSR